MEWIGNVLGLYSTIETCYFLILSTAKEELFCFSIINFGEWNKGTITNLKSSGEALK